MSRCEAPWLQPCPNQAYVLTMYETEPLLVRHQCRKDLGDFEAYHLERGDLAGPKEAFESWYGKP